MKKIIIITLLILRLSGCGVGNTEISNSELENIKWVEIESPPGEDGPCYAFFLSSGYQGYRGYGYAGVWCR